MATATVLDAPAVNLTPITAEQLLDFWRDCAALQGGVLLAALQPYQQELERVAHETVATMDEPERLLSDRGARQAITAVLSQCSILNVLAAAQRVVDEATNECSDFVP